MQVLLCTLFSCCRICFLFSTNQVYYTSDASINDDNELQVQYDKPCQSSVSGGSGLGEEAARLALRRGIDKPRRLCVDLGGLAVRPSLQFVTV